MNVRRRICALGATLVVAGLVATGCSDDPAHPKPLPSKSATESNSASSAADAPSPSMPQGARGGGDASAKAFAGYWVLTLNHSAQTGSSTELRKLSSKACEACTAISDLIDKVAARGGDIRGAGWDLKRASVVHREAGGKVVIDALVNVQPQTLIRKAGASPERFTGGERHKKFWLRASSDTWKVTRLEQPE